MATRVLVTCYE